MAALAPMLTCVSIPPPPCFVVSSASFQVYWEAPIWKVKFDSLLCKRSTIYPFERSLEPSSVGMGKEQVLAQHQAKREGTAQPVVLGELTAQTVRVFLQS